MGNEKNWYVVYTKSRNEKKVADLLRKKKIKSYCPRYNEVRYWQDKRKVVSVPLFSSMIFVYATEQDHPLIKQAEGVLSILFWLSKPAIIRRDEITAIRYFLEQHDNVRLEKIKIQTGQLTEEDNGIIGISTQKVCLSSLGYALVAESSVLQEEKIVA